jgi:predicted PurR-regulated permease PerM
MRETSHHMGPRIFAGIVLFLFFALAVYWGFQVVQGVMMPLIFAGLIAIAITPIYNYIKKYARSAYVSSLLSCVLLIFALGGIISFIVYLAVGEVVSITSIVTQSVVLPDVNAWADLGQWNAIINQLSSRVEAFNSLIPFIDIGTFSSLVTEALKSVTPLLQDLSSTLLSAIKLGLNGIGTLLFNLMLFLIILFFLLIDGKNFIRYIFNLLPINVKHEEQILKRFQALSYSWIVVSFAMATLQATIAGIGYSIAGVPSPIVWGIVTGLAAFIPFVGAALIWAPLSLIYLVLGQYFWGIFLLIWGLILVSSSDNFIRPFLLRGGGIELHPLILFIAVFGGFFAYGVFGLILGPIIVVFVSTVLYIYQLEFGPTLSRFHKARMERDVE